MSFSSVGRRVHWWKVLGDTAAIIVDEPAIDELGSSERESFEGRIEGTFEAMNERNTPRSKACHVPSRAINDLD